MKKLVAASLFASLALPSQLLAAAAANTNTQAEIEQLKHRIAALEKTTDVNETRNYTVGTNMQFGVGSGTYAEELYIIDFGLNRDLSLLHERQYINSKYKRFEEAPHLLFSGNISGTAGKHSDAFGVGLSDHQEFMKGSAEIDMTGMINDDWLGYLEFSADAFDTDTGFFVDQAFTTWGNYDKTPMYVTLGYMYVPFGNFTTNFIDSTLVQEMGRIQVAAANGGFNVFEKDNWQVNGAVFWFDGSTKASDNFRLDQVGANLQARKTKLGPQHDMSLMFGASVVNNLASSQGISGALESPPFDFDRLDHYVPAVDARVKFTKGPFAVTSEYLTAYRNFDEFDLAQGNVADVNLNGARPTAVYVEAAYDFKIWGMNSTLSGRYDQTTDALAFGLPAEEYGASYQLKPYFNTRVTFEYLHKNDYSESTVATGHGSSVFGTGQSDDLFQAQINVFF